MSNGIETKTTSLKSLILLATTAFLATVIAVLPASLLTPVLDSDRLNLGYRQVEGTLWSGVIHDVSINQQSFGDVTYRLAPLSILRGKFSARIKAQGGVARGVGHISAGLFGNDIEITRARVDYDLSALKRYSIFGLPYQGRFRANINKIAWARAGGCKAADAQVSTDILDASAKQYLGEGIVLDGLAHCEGADLALDLQGQNSQGTTRILVGLTPQMTYRLSASVEPTRQRLGENLRRLGFQDEGTSLVYDAKGEIRGLRS